MPLLGLLLALAAGVACYLASPHRRWRIGSSLRPWRWLAAVCALAALIVWVRALGVFAGFFTCLSALMLAWVALPYLGAARRQD
jgi:hypothetical protein